eukprot:2510733-Amphidinium_carterae.1
MLSAAVLAHRFLSSFLQAMVSIDVPGPHDQQFATPKDPLRAPHPLRRSMSKKTSIVRFFVQD